VPASQMESVKRCRALATETAIGLLSCRERGDEVGTKMLLRTYAADAEALHIHDKRAQSLLLSALTATAISGYRQLARAQDTTIESVLRAESLKVSAWAAGSAD
jgi:hypothetical protein